MTNKNYEVNPPPERPRFRFALRDLLGFVTIGCLLGGLSLWSSWWFEERVLLLTWGISLALGEYFAQRNGRSIWWPLLASIISTGIAYFTLRSIDERWDGSTWSEYAWNVWRLWAVLLGAATAASLMVLLAVRSLPRVPVVIRTIANRIRLRWLTISISAVGMVVLALYWSLGAAIRWSPHRAVRWHAPSLPQVLFCSDQREFVTVDDAGRMTLWDWNTARALSQFRAEVPKSDDPPSFSAATLSGNRLALASSIRDSVTVYRLPDWKLERKFSHEDIRNHPISGIYSLNDGEQLLIVYRTSDGLIHFTFWDELNQKFLEDVSHDGGSAVVFGVSSSGRYCGMVKRVDYEEATLTIIDFETASVILEMEYGRGSGPVVFFHDDRKIAHVTQMFDLDGKNEQELPGVALGVIPGTNRLRSCFKTVGVWV